MFEHKVQTLSVKHHVGSYNSAAGTLRYALTARDMRKRIRLAAFHAIIAVDRAVKLVYGLRSSLRVQAVDVLCDHAGKSARALQLGKLFVGGVWKHAVTNHFCTIKIIK